MTLDEASAAARERYGRLTPYRLGFVMGEAGEIDPPNPYPRLSPRAWRLFYVGVGYGQEHRARKLAKQQEITDV
jgi:hypothetical protein